MIISVVGDTDKRPVLYTILAMSTLLGDVWFVTNDRHFKRLLGEDIEEGNFNNILVSVADTTEDEVYSDLGHMKEDFDFIVFDNLAPSDADLVIFVQGEKISEDEQFLLDSIDKYETILLGFGKGCVPYTTKMFKQVEHTEACQCLCNIDAKLTAAVAKLLTDFVKVPESTLRKAVP